MDDTACVAFVAFCLMVRFGEDEISRAMRANRDFRCSGTSKKPRPIQSVLRRLTEEFGLDRMGLRRQLRLEDAFWQWNGNVLQMIFWRALQLGPWTTRPVPLAGATDTDLPVFWPASHEVTQHDYQRVMGTNPAHFSNAGDGKAAVTRLVTDNLPGRERLLG